jgi:hypothetical protein
MFISTKNKILVGLLSLASAIVFTLCVLFYTLSSGELNTVSGAKTSSDFAKASMEEPDTKESAQFSIFSILNKFIPN